MVACTGGVRLNSVRWCTPRRQLLAAWGILRRMLTMHYLRDGACRRASGGEDVIDLLRVLAEDVAPPLRRRRQQGMQRRVGRCVLTSTRSATAISVMLPPLVSSSSGWTPENSV